MDNVIKKSNDTEKTYSSESLIQKFEKNANNYPQNIAIESDAGGITYAQLNNKANAIGKKLKDCGIGRNDVVAVCIRRSTEMIEAIYGILKAGAAYLPLDPEFPQQRLNYMISDACPKAVFVIDQANARKFNEKKLKVIDLKTDIPDGNYDNLNIQNEPDDTAYVIYTSGTTGNPKGVMNRHLSLKNRIEWMDDQYALHPDDVILQKTTVTFDVSVWEILWWGMKGARTAILKPGGERDPSEICNAIYKYHITTIHFVPSMFQAFLTYISENKEITEKLTCLRKVFLSGEALKVKQVEQFWSFFKYRDIHLVNLYGPTEAAIDVTYYECKEKQDIIPIGKPISNIKIHIVKNFEECGIQDAGELCIAGVGLAKGYINQSELTKKFFVANPFDGGIMYRSGDLARWLPDGNIEFLGRIDNQVKIRGIRVELGEIESKLTEIKEISQAVVVEKEDKSGLKAIYAYLISSQKLDIREIKAKLRKLLPDYMIPGYMMQIDQIPVNRNGKLDRNALPKIKQQRYAEYAEAENECQRNLISIFKNVLRIEEPVGIDDSFFDLGGHSLRAAYLSNSIMKMYRRHVSVEDIYQYPTVRKLSAFMQQLSGESKADSLRHIQTVVKYPMSYAQRNIYLAQIRNPAEASYNIVSCYKIVGVFDKKRFEKAVRETVRKNEILRTAFKEEQGNLYQLIYDEIKTNVEYEENLTDSIREIYLNYPKPFDLAMLPLFRIKIVSARDGYYMLLDIHHIISDGTGTEIFLEMLIDEYHNRAGEIEFQYKDYSEWERKQDYSSQREYWRKELSQITGRLNLPADKIRTRIRSDRGGSISCGIDPSLKGALVSFCRENNCSEYMVLLSVFMVLLHKYSRQNDILVGTPVSGRGSLETQGMLGMFVNTVVMRGRPDKKIRFTDFLKEVSQTAFLAYANQNYPFELLVSDLEDHTDRAFNNLFDVMFIMQNTEKLHSNDVEFTLEPIRLPEVVSKFDITLEVLEENEGYELVWEYSYDLYHKQTAEIMLSHYVELLRQAIENPSFPLEQLNVLSENEEERILHGFNPGHFVLKKETGIYHEFVKSVEKYPHRVAVIEHEREITYYGLFQKAASIAGRLREYGVEQNSFVPLILEKGISCIAAIMGVLQAGAAFVPVDRNYPLKRIEYILKDCNARIVICEETDRELGKMLKSMKISEIRTGNEPPAYNMEKNPIAYRQDDLAYLIYTSGTTGNPKGVMIEQRGLLELCQDFSSKFCLEPGKRILNHTNISFDPFIEEVFPALLSGAALVVSPPKAQENMRLLCDFMYEKQVDIADFCPLVLSELLPHLKKKHCVKQIICGGDNLPAALINEVRKLEIELYNHYGPSEITVDATSYLCTGDTRNIIGKPFAGKKVYIMNENQLCGIGIPGEICIEGNGVARGYLNTAESGAFVESPFHEKNRMYRSGDLGRWLPDGNIEYLGRIDKQVKINGIRIELSEIETVIKRSEQVRDAVVAAQEYNGEHVLAAYIVSEQAEEKGAGSLKEEISNILPAYMMPSFWFFIDAVPVTTNGKVDYNQLSKFFLPQEGNEKDRPRNERENKVCNLFKEILMLRSVGIFDNFFELGGHSLKAIYLVNRMEDEFGKRLSVRDIYRNPTVASISKIIGNRKQEERIPANDCSRAEMSYAQRAIYITDQLDESGMLYNITKCYKIVGKLKLSDLQQAFRIIVQKNEILRTVFQVIDGVFMQIIQEQTETEISYRKLNQKKIEDAVEEIRKPFHLQTGPLVRLTYIEDDKQACILIEMHHIISDGTSFNLFVDQLLKLCNGFKVKENRLQYKDYSIWHNKKDSAEEKQYWLTQLADYPQNVEIMPDYARKKIRSMRGSSIQKMIDRETCLAVKKFALDYNYSEYMILLSAYLILLKRYGRQEDMIVGCPMSGRIHTDIDEMLGMFVNTVPIRCVVDENQIYRKFLDEIKEITLSAYDYQDYPFEKMLEELGVKSEPSRNPLYDTVFVLQNTYRVGTSYEAYQFEEIPLKAKWCNYDLVMEVNEEEDTYRIVMEYNADLYQEESMFLFAEQYLQLLKNILDHPQDIIMEISESGREEKTRLLKQCKSAADRIQYQSINELLKEQVVHHGHKIALRDKNGDITFDELYKRVNAMARFLRDNGLGRNQYAVIISDKSSQTIISILAVLRAGGAYVPIDRELPSDRILYIIEDCKPQVLIYKNISAKLKEKLDHFNCALADLGQDKIFAQSDAELPDQNEKNDLAYLIYTSGTTGKPKGVMIEHEGVIRLSTYYRTHTDLTEDDIMLQFANITFDAMTAELSVSIFAGNTLCVIDQDMQKSVHKLSEYIRQNRISMAILPPNIVPFLDISSLKTLITAGSELPAEQYDNIIKTNRGLQYRNEYGPTEATVCAAIWNMDQQNRRRIPIGKAIAGKSVYIMNGNNLCGVNIPGEICIGGKGLARGYLNMPALTAEKFTDNPFEAGRLYRTGDIGRLLSDGNIDFLGRMDDQVKLNGFRIELEEIEKNIRSMPGVADAVVTVKKTDRQVLCAYIKMNDSAHSDRRQVCQWLSERIPGYMLPHYYAFIREIPLTKNGKIDYEKLPYEKSENFREYTPPRTPAEKSLIEEAKLVLDVNKIGIYDEYYLVGGDSIKAIELVNRLYEKGYRLEVVDVLKRNVFAEIAMCMERTRTEEILPEMTLEESEISAINQFFQEKFNFA